MTGSHRFKLLLDRWRRIRSKEPAPPGSPFIQRYRTALVSLAGVALVLVVAVVFLYVHYARKIEEKLGGGTLRTYSSIYAAPKLIGTGDSLSIEEVIEFLQRAGYTEGQGSKTGRFQRTANGLEIETGPNSYFQPHNAVISFGKKGITKIQSSTDRRDANRYWLEPELITNVLDADRGKRRPVAYSELPRHLIEAVVSVEDKRFFQHGGLDFIRVAKAVYVDVKEGRKEQGASTLTMQLARTFWLDQEKTWTRKFREVLLSAELERRFSKERILELYANEVYLGRRGSFGIHGFGQAARAYFGKEARDLTIAESAMLAGIIQRPSFYNPFRYPDRVKERRNLVLTLMHRNGHLDERQLAEATAEPVKLSPGETESTDAPYFADLVNEELQSKFQDWDFAANSYKVYSTLDLDLQRQAVDAVRVAMTEVDKNVRRKHGKKNKDKAPQVALIALDPHTGDIKALVGGRSYGESQLNRVLAKRQPGSAFKPFVWAAAFQSSLDKKSAVVTPATTFVDEPTRFVFNRQAYEPANYEHAYNGDVTARLALIKSLNIPTVKAAEAIGYKPVVDVARAAGIESDIDATPSLALGSYDMTPMEIAEAYTIFTNNGVHVKRSWVTAIRDINNRAVFKQTEQKNEAIDPRVAYMLVDMMQDVVRSGTAAEVRARGFAHPAAGKTGTARDGWFAGFTSNLLCIVWVGFDDYTDLNLEGSKSALPVWTEFMKRAHKLREYAAPKPFKVPPGLVSASIDLTTGLLASDWCPAVRTEYFIAGTQPQDMCESDHDDDYEDDEIIAEDGERPNRKGVFGRILGVFR